ncbi:hypothetical protein TNCV_1863861 [Trichonephila clavipes]|nr:hypothetical protein TNCV_1863861 [Trichonephila clavipes]
MEECRKREEHRKKMQEYRKREEYRKKTEERRLDEQVQMLTADRDAVAQPVAVEEKKGLSNAMLISAEDEMYERKGETPVDVIKDKVKEDVDPIILS